MKRTWSSLALLLALLHSADAQPRQFSMLSPDEQFEAICDFSVEPPFKIRSRTNNKIVAAMDDERVGNHGLDAAWAPDSKTLVVLVEWRLSTAIHVFRLVGGRFERTEGPDSPEAFLTLKRWIAPNRVLMKGDRKLHALILTDKAAEFEH